jgi:hypothetical protein
MNAFRKLSIVLSAAFFWSTATAPASLRVDFSAPSQPVQPGFQGYFATHEVGTTFTTQSYSAFNTTVAVAPTWSVGSVNAAKQMVDRGGNDGTDAENLLRRH